MIDPFYHLQRKLEKRKESRRFRSLKSISEKPKTSCAVINGIDFLNLSSNDYLGLAAHPLLIERSREYTLKFGAGASSSRLVTGTLDIHTALEEKIAGLFSRERALLYNTGFQANSTILPAITGKNDLIFADKKCHNSILTGCLASGARFHRYRHNDLNHLESLLQKEQPSAGGNRWIVSESVFSMDGDRAPLNEITTLSKKYGSLVYIDDAHSFGVNGKNGLGEASAYPEIDIIVNTFGKAGGSFGAFVLCNTTVANALINFSNGLIYTTALPPPVLGAMDAALELIPAMDQERSHLSVLSRELHANLVAAGYTTADQPSHILPVITGNDGNALELSHKLYNHHILASAIRPPTVPEREARIRLSLSSDHTIGDINRFMSVLRL